MNNGPARRFNQEGLKWLVLAMPKLRGLPILNTGLEELYNDDFSEEIGLTQMTIYEGNRALSFYPWFTNNLVGTGHEFRGRRNVDLDRRHHFNNILSQKKMARCKCSNV